MTSALRSAPSAARRCTCAGSRGACTGVTIRAGPALLRLWQFAALGCICVLFAVVAAPAFAACPVSETAPIAQLRADVARLAAQGQRPDAISCLQREIARREPTDAQLAADLRIDLGKLFDDAGDFANAKSQFALALRAFEQSARRAPLAEATRRLGWAEYRLGDYTSAEAHLRHAVELHITANGPKSLEVGRALNSLGVVLR